MLASLLKSLFTHRRKPAAAAAAASQARPAGSPKRVDVGPLLDYAGSLASDDLPLEFDAAVRRFANVFDACRVDDAKRALVVYHVDLPAGETISYRDLESFDPHHFDFAAVLTHMAERMRVFCPRAVLYFVTGEGSDYESLSAPDVRIVRLPVDRTQPMLQRALAVCAYVHSAAFSADTAFLDSDAFPNLPLDPVFDLEFDVALTYRDEFGVMPVNEAVVFTRGGQRAVVQTFFRRIVATYARLASDPRIGAYYGDIKRWRGGQLALNAVVQGMRPFSSYRRASLDGVRLLFLPCDTFNFTFDYRQDPATLDLSRRHIIHLKGRRKEALWKLREALAQHRPARPA
jgi:hypothetical protein